MIWMVKPWFPVDCRDKTKETTAFPQQRCLFQALSSTAKEEEQRAERLKRDLDGRWVKEK